MTGIISAAAGFVAAWLLAVALAVREARRAYRRAGGGRS